MHPALRLSNLSSLPVLLKRLAENAARGNIQALYALSARLHGLPKSTLSLLLPVYYANLDTAPIASLQQLETLDRSQARTMIHRAVHALQYVRQLASSDAIPREAYPVMWPRIWQWVQFIDSFRDHLPLEGEQLLALYESFVTLLRVIARQDWNLPQEDRYFLKGAGPRFVLARAWKELLRADDRMAILGVSEVLYFDKPNIYDEVPERFDGILSGAGGTWLALARLIIDHLRYTIPRHDIQVTDSELQSVDNIRSLAIDSFDGSLRNALLENGFIPMLTRVCRALSVSSMRPGTLNLLHNYFLTLTIAIYTRSTRKWIIQSLKAGLLPVIVELGSQSPNASAGVMERVEIWLKATLPDVIIYSSALSQLHLSLLEVGIIYPSLAARFTTPALKELWEQLESVVNQRMALLEAHERQNHGPRRACDNIECGKLLPKEDLKQCSQCHSRFYCSHSCQRKDWQAIHRTFCEEVMRLDIRKEQGINSKDLSFLPTILEHDFRASRNVITVQLLRFMHTHSGTGRVLHVYFNYSKGPCQLFIDGGEAVKPDALYRENLLRVKQSGGLMQMHLIRLPCFWRDTFYSIPLRLTNTHLHDGLLRILESVPTPLRRAAQGEPVHFDSAPYEAQVRKLVFSFLDDLSWSY